MHFSRKCFLKHTARKQTDGYIRIYKNKQQLSNKVRPGRVLSVYLPPSITLSASETPLSASVACGSAVSVDIDPVDSGLGDAGYLDTDPPDGDVGAGRSLLLSGGRPLGLDRHASGGNGCLHAYMLQNLLIIL